jgi:hypothetical protein
MINASADDGQDDGESEGTPDVIGILSILLGPPGCVIGPRQDADDDQESIPVNGKVGRKLDDDGIKRWSH